MSDQERPLPRPQKTPFGRQRSAPEQSGQDLLADRMAAAAAEGRLDEFLKENMPESEHAQALAKMMMGMTGMMPGSVPMPAKPDRPQEPVTSGPTGPVPEDLAKAVQGGDVRGLMDMLRQEHLKRTPDSALAGPADASRESNSAQPTAPVIDKELIDAMIRIAQDNSVSLDWIILRAIKVYVEEYRRTGKL